MFVDSCNAAAVYVGFELHFLSVILSCYVRCFNHMYGEFIV